MDPQIWEPYVRMVCARHRFACRQLHPGFPGTFPTFIVELEAESAHHSPGFIVLKFFGPLFDGAVTMSLEQATTNWVILHLLPIPSPRIQAAGQLTPGWGYLAFEHIPGVSINQVRQQITARDMTLIAGQMGRFMKELHVNSAAALAGGAIPGMGTGWDEFTSFLDAQRAACLDHHRQWNDLPPHLLEQLPGFIPPVDQLVDLRSPAHLIHNDLTGDHLLGSLAASQEQPSPGSQEGEQVAGGWNTRAIIDWGDVRTGNILYELATLHLELFRADRALLRTCLDAYSLPAFCQQDFPTKALSMVMLHQFPMPPWVYVPHREAPTLHDLANRLYAI